MMVVDARPKEIVRLWPKLPVAAAPEYTIELMPAAPMASEAFSITVLASCAIVLADRMVMSRAVTAAVFDTSSLQSE